MDQLIESDRKKDETLGNLVSAVSDLDKDTLQQTKNDLLKQMKNDLFQINKHFLHDDNGITFSPSPVEEPKKPHRQM